MPSEMQERIARALHRHMGGPTAWDDLPERSRELFRGGATAAMRAMRDPNTRMLAAAQTAWRDDPEKRTSTLWTAMVDAEIAAAAAGDSYDD